MKYAIFLNIFSAMVLFGMGISANVDRYVSLVFFVLASINVFWAVYLSKIIRQGTVIKIIIISLFLSGNSFADDVLKIRTVNAIIGEAEGETYKGKLAVACAIKNRTITHGSFNKAMRGVFGENAPRVREKKYSSRTFVDAVRAYEESNNNNACEFIDGADHWEGTAFKQPKWSKNMVVTATIGNQRFYRYASK